MTHSPKLAQETTNVAVALQEIRTQLAKLGLWKTYHAMDTPLKVLGYEAADLLIQKKAKLRKPKEPVCPECKVRVNRPKCFFELGSDCPRHPLREAWMIECKKIDHLREQMKKRKKS